jgi:hypothetical protein
MSMIAGALSFDHQWRPTRAARRMALDCCRYAELGSDTLIEDQRIACHAIRRFHPQESLLQACSTAGERFVVVGDFASARLMQRHLSAGSTEQRERALQDLDGRWIALAYDPRARSVRITTDRLGIARVFLARTAGGYLFCSDYGVLAASLPHTPHIDHETLLCELALGYTPDERTCFEEIMLLPPGATVELSRRGLAVRALHTPAYGDCYAGLGSQQKLARLDSQWEATGEEWCAGRKGNVLVEPEGIASLHALALAQRHGLSVHTLSAGSARGEPARRARAVARRFGCHLIDPVPSAPTWEAWGRSARQLGFAPFPWAAEAEGRLSLARRSAAGLVTGALAEAFTGACLPEAEEREDLFARWEATAFAGGWLGSPLLRESAGAMMREVARERLRALAAQANGAFPHQQVLHCALYGPERRRLSMVCALAGRYLAPMPVFYSRHTLHFWGNVGTEDLRQQALYRTYLQTRAPQVLDILRPGLGARLRSAAQGLTGRLWPATARSDGTRWAERLLVRHREEALGLVREVLPLVEPLFHRHHLLDAVERFPRGGLEPVQLGRLLSAFAVLKLLHKESRSQRSQERLS